MIRFAFPAALVTAALLLLAPAAGAATQCGAPAGPGEEPPQGSLVLKTEGSITTLDFGRSSDQKKLIFEFEVTGCRLTSTEELTAKAHASEGDEAFGTPAFELDDSKLTVELPVDPGKFDVGKHSAAVTVNGPTVIGATTKVSVQKNEGILLPTLIAVFAGLAGIGAAIFSRAFVDKDDVKVKGVRMVVAAGAGGFAVLTVWLTAYGEVEIWEATPKAVVAMIIAAATAAYGGAVASLLGNSVKPK